MKTNVVGLCIVILFSLIFATNCRNRPDDDSKLMQATSTEGGELYGVGNRQGWAGSTGKKDHYLDNVQPLFNKRCVACHGCYEAPCQANYQSYEAIRRGFNPQQVFGTFRFKELPATRQSKPTKPFDSDSLSAWRGKGFLPVTSEGETKVEDCLMYRFIKQGSEKNIAKNAEKGIKGFSPAPLIPFQEETDKNLTHRCVATKAQMKQFYGRSNPWGVVSVDDFLKENPQAGMPWGLPRLENNEEKLFIDWLKAGAKGPSDEAQITLAASAIPDTISEWEEFLNEETPKAKLTARYIYEHVFTAHIVFDKNPNEFYELVRAKNAPGSKGLVDQIVTPLPYDSPGDTFYYRMKKITRAIVQKTQIIWHLNNAKLKHLRELFLESGWGTGHIHVAHYGNNNPFEVFERIPAKIRSRFLIENSQVMIGALVQGSVCVGSRATYAISDHFWAWFLKPESDVSVLTPKLGLKDWDDFRTARAEWVPKTIIGKALRKRLIARQRNTLFGRAVAQSVANFLSILDPSAISSGATMADKLYLYRFSGKEIVDAIHHFFRSSKSNRTLKMAYEKTLRAWLEKEKRAGKRKIAGLTLDDIWQGDGDSSYPGGLNPNSWINVTRHEHNSTLQFGPEGGMPPKFWVMSFSNFEILYYNLVASYKEWGSVGHKVSTWRHMSYIRLFGEDLGLSFLPIDHRQQARNDWTRGLGALKNRILFPHHSVRRIPKAGGGILSRNVWPPRPAVKSTRGGDFRETIRNFLDQMYEHNLVFDRPEIDKDTSKRGKFETALHDVFRNSKSKYSERTLANSKVSFPRHFPNITFATVDFGSEGIHVYTILANRGYKGHNLMLLEILNREESGDSLSLYRGYVGAYPELFLEVPKEKVSTFAADIAKVTNAASWQSFLNSYAIPRNSCRMWPHYDWIHEKGMFLPGSRPEEHGIMDLSQYEYFETAM